MQGLGFGCVVIDCDYLNAIANGLASQRMIQIDLHLVVVKTDYSARQCIAVVVCELDDLSIAHAAVE